MSLKRRKKFILCAIVLMMLTGCGEGAGDGKKSMSASADTQSTGKGQVTICILDSGDNAEGAEGKNYIDGSDDLTDSENHGTLVARLIYAIAPDADVYMLKCFDQSADIESTEETGQAVCAALRDAADVYHADLINMSWTLSEENDTLHDAVRYAEDAGAVMVAAAGNLSPGTPLGSLVYPAAWDEVIGVAGADLDDAGDPVSSLWYLRSKAVFISADGNYRKERGSSFAAPRITGALAAHSISTGENLTMDSAEAYLKSIAEDAGDPGYDTVFGWGFVRTP